MIYRICTASFDYVLFFARVCQIFVIVREVTDITANFNR